MTTEEKIVNTTVEETNEVSTNEVKETQFIEVKKDSFFKRAGKGIGKIAKKAGRGVKKVVTSPVTKALAAGIAVGATGALTYVISKGIQLAEHDEEPIDVTDSAYDVEHIDNVDETSETAEQTEAETEGETGD